ncbi:methyltransferase domain-containing protein [Streptomyces albipurpureus]|uniref:Methyltransferase domain-containing protein n=1 Tax=Streptomyces albipurpureus TaxID=2897419 RepID=A0ABT0UHW0_9ACTN|nr:methyltransferase domain-containing protein [Streptomyces sp. CWNU-1]MCM2388228.1 methyltransferase domain-containing protein [Streptomyces sp. CWNU-1]
MSTERDGATAGAGEIAQEVGAFYDATELAWEAALGKSTHHGYWDDPRDASVSLEQAQDRMIDVVGVATGLDAGRRLLDVGCGRGRAALRLAAATGAHAEGVSVSAFQISIATAAAAEEGLTDRVRFQVADVVCLPYPDASFDVAVLMESACHFESKTTALREIRRVLVPGGRIVLEDVLTARGADPGRWAEVNRLIPVSFVTSDSWKALLEAEGFTGVSVHDIKSHVRPTYAAQLVNLARNRDDLASKIGEEPTALIEHLCRATSALGEEGVMSVEIITAHAPAF